MRVKLIQATQNPIDVMWTAARTCYSAKSPVEMWEDTIKQQFVQKLKDDCSGYEEKDEINQKHWNLVKKVLDSGHQSIAEHVYFTFAIEGISRACSHQLVRHRAGIVFSQQSQRYVEIKEDYHYLEGLHFDLFGPSDDEDEVMNGEKTYDELVAEEQKLTAEILDVLQNYFVDVNEKNFQPYLQDLLTYLENVHPVLGGMKAEDARNVLPNATKTNITMSVNFRELIHICNLRLCTRAQLEIRNLFKEIVKCVKEVDERLASYLVPSCEVHGVCQEKMCCGRKPKFEDVIKSYKERSEYTSDIEDALTPEMIEAMKNPQFNEKLSKLLKEPTVFEDYMEVTKELQELKEKLERDENA